MRQVLQSRFDFRSQQQKYEAITKNGHKKVPYHTIIIYSFAKVSMQKQWSSNMANDSHLNMLLPINGTWIVKKNL